MRWVPHKMLENTGDIKARVINVSLHHYSVKILIESPQLDKEEWFC